MREKHVSRQWIAVTTLLCARKHTSTRTQRRVRCAIRFERHLASKAELKFDGDPSAVDMRDGLARRREDYIETKSITQRENGFAFLS